MPHQDLAKEQDLKALRSVNAGLSLLRIMQKTYSGNINIAPEAASIEYMSIL